MGGLGNQLFQYAFGRSLAIERDEELVFFTAGKARIDRPLDILSLNTEIELPDKDINSEIYRFPYDGFLFRAERRLRKYLPQLSGKLFIEKNLEYSPPGLGFSYFDGYWQSFRYFNHYYNSFSDHLSPREGLEFNGDLIQLIKSSESVGVHVRTGDYAASGRRNPHFCLDAEYYSNAFREITHRINNPVFVIFSDDPAGVSSSFGLQGRHDVVYATHNTDNKTVADLFTLSLCRHNIIANSSFSWWGAFLNKNRDKIVIAPSKWYRDWVRYKIEDILPESWIRIPL